MFRIKEVADVFVDACVRDESGQLLFLSCYGRDTAIQQLFAAFYLKSSEGGLEHFHLREADAESWEEGERVHVGNADGLQKLSGRLPRDNVFGNLAHTWIYDPAIVRPDRATRTAWVIDPLDKGNEVTSDPERVLLQVADRVWEVFRLLSPVPLLDAWRPTLLDSCFADCVTDLSETAFPPLGCVSANKVTVPDSFVDTVSTLVKNGSLRLIELKAVA